MLDPVDESSNCMFDYFNDYRRVSGQLAAAHSYEDRKWIFCQEGPVQSFENAEYYTRRKIKDRFNRDVITEYMLKLGYDITHNDFWATDKPAWVVWTDFNETISGPMKRNPGIWSADG